MDEEIRKEITEISRKYSVILDKIQIYDSLVHLVNYLQEKVESGDLFALEAIKSLEEKCKHSWENSSILNSSYMSLANKNEMAICDLSQSHQLLDKAVQEIRSDYQSLYETVGKIHSELKDHSNSSISKLEMADFQKYHSVSIHSIYSVIANLESKLDKLSVKSDYLLSKVVLNEGAVEQIERMIYDIPKEMELSTKKQADDISYLNNSIERKIAASQSQNFDRFIELNNKIDGLPLIDDVKKELISKINLLELSVSNTKMKMENHEAQITIMERKVEGIVFKQKNNELTK